MQHDVVPREWAAEAGAAIEAEVELDAVAARDIDPPAPVPIKRTWLDRVGIVDLIRSRCHEEWVSIGLGITEIVRCRAGGLITLQGPTGGGKTSLMGGIILRHAREFGWALVLSRELTIDEFGARMIGSQTDASWEDVLKGQLSNEVMLGALPERLHIAGRDDATLHQLDKRLAKLREHDAEVPVMFAVDYGQIVVDEDDPRTRVTKAWQRADDLARKHRAVGFILSQMSRANSKAARNGERLGADALDGGAESAAVERYSTVVLEIGAVGGEDQHGMRDVSLSLAKGRMSGGDVVIPMRYEGRTGRWAVIGEAKPASEVKAQARAKTDDVKLRGAMALMKAHAEAATAPVTRSDLRAAAACGRDTSAAAILRLIADGILVEVAARKKRSRDHLLWSAEKAALAGLELKNEVQ